jgi:hypothetical protein
VVGEVEALLYRDGRAFSICKYDSQILAIDEDMNSTMAKSKINASDFMLNVVRWG